MRSFPLLVLVSVVGVCSLASGEAAAQPRPGQPVYVPGQPVPPISPYLNLFRRGSSVANNYYNLVVPQVNTAADLRRLEQGVATNRNAIVQAALAASGELPPTGRGAPGFNTHTRYFLNRGGGGPSGSTVPGITSTSFPSAVGTGLFSGLDLELAERERALPTRNLPRR